MPELSIIIPARNEMFLRNTIEDILKNIEGDTEIISILDGYWPVGGLPNDPRITIVHYEKSIGQRAAINVGSRISTAKYILKCDAHCCFDKGFDVKLMSDMKDNWTIVPTMKNLHAFNWKCPDGHIRYQSPSGPCTQDIGNNQICGKNTMMDIVWTPRHRTPNSNSYLFDTEPHFQYFNDFCKRPEGQGDLTPSMSLQGSLFMTTRKKFKQLDMCDESFGSWGSQGIEVACKTWLSGGEVIANHKTWYAHMFRTQGGDFGFPYDQSGNQVEHAKRYAKELFFERKWIGVLPLSWLIRKFMPVPGWTEEDILKLEANGN